MQIPKVADAPRPKPWYTRLAGKQGELLTEGAIPKKTLPGA
jgi:hypothetical protein